MAEKSKPLDQKLSDMTADQMKRMLDRLAARNEQLSDFQTQYSNRFSDFLMIVSTGGIGVTTALIANFSGPPAGRILLIISAIALVFALLLVAAYVMAMIVFLKKTVSDNSDDLTTMLLRDNLTVGEYQERYYNRLATGKVWGIRPQPLRIWAFALFVVGATLAIIAVALPLDSVSISPPPCQ